MKIHEYQGKEILRNFGVPVPRGYPAFTVLEASEAAQKLGGARRARSAGGRRDVPPGGGRGARFHGQRGASFELVARAGP